MTVRLVSRRVVLPDGDGLRVQPALITVEGARITSVDAAPEGGEDVVDFGDRLIAPAFVNAHTHLALGFLRGAPQQVFGSEDARTPDNLVEDLYFHHESRLREGDVRAFARIGAYESLLGGVGLVWDHYYRGEEVADALVDTGLSGVVAPTLQDLNGPGADVWESQLGATEAIAASASYADRGIFAALGPHATDTVSGELFGRAAELAEARQLPMHLHCAQSVEEYERLHERQGASPVAWLHALGVLDRAPTTLLVHCLYASRADLRLLSPQRHALGFCPYSQLIFGFTAPVDVWSEHGLRWVVGTDCAASNDSWNVQKELRGAASWQTAPATWSPTYRAFLENGGVEGARATWRERSRFHERAAGSTGAPQLLSRVWSQPGALHPAFRAGVIAEGALANLVVWDVDHPSFWPAPDPLRVLAFGDTTAAIHAMWVAGRPVGTAGAFHQSLVDSDDYRDARKEADARLAALLAR